MYDIALEILNCISNFGYEAYIVGGFPRDKYLGIKSLDIDITTSALYEDLYAIFKDNIVERGFLSYQLNYKDYQFEITTYRKELYSENNRFPIVEPAKTLEEDLKRRDFTINTLCIDKEGNYLDLMGAKQDLKKQIIKSVGESDKKIKEDFLRSLRAVRFAVTLDFEIDEDLAKSITKYNYLLKNLSVSRTNSELKEILKYPRGIELIKELNLDKFLKYSKVEYNRNGDNMKPLLLCILDGVGISENIKGNAYKLADTPNLDALFNRYPHSLLEASGTAVGLPEGQMGNSEVGHSNIGAGRIVYQAIQMINNEIDNNNFYHNSNILEMFKYVKDNNSKLHLMGLVSDGGVHSSLKHLQALIDMCYLNNINFYLHIFTDGRDTLPNSSLDYINSIDLKNGKISTISGRYYAMDRDNRYERIKKAYDVVTGTSASKYESVEEAIKINYENNITDEFIIPGIINEDGIVTDNDGVIFFNFRPDRLRELGTALSNNAVINFDKDKEVNIKLLTMMPVSDTVINKTIYNLNNLDNTLGEYLSKLGYKQLRIAETEKYAHVTYFFDGGKELELNGCERILINSPKVATYDLVPEMSANEITDRLLEKMEQYDIIILNFANGDMVGHTGNLDAAIKAVETLDDCVDKIVDKLEFLNGTLILTADHGNCEEMIDENNNILTSHTTNKVPFLINKDYKLKDGKLADIAPTILYLLNEKIPEEMTGNVLIEKNLY